MACAMAATCNCAIDFVKPGSDAAEIFGGRPVVRDREIRGVEFGYRNPRIAREVPGERGPASVFTNPSSAASETVTSTLAPF